MEKINILWVDDEIDLLKPHIIFLEEKGYTVSTVKSGDEALDVLDNQYFDIVFLDENMPGLSGLDTLGLIKSKYLSLPVVMITKSEEETIMDQAIGSNISDYLIKPLNPNQILLCLKKILENKELISQKTTLSYQQEFLNIGNVIRGNLTYKEWIDIYKKFVFWELELEKAEDQGMVEILNMQKKEANHLFSKFIQENYLNWLKDDSKNNPILSHILFKEKILDSLSDNSCTFVIVIDNFRYDQWKSVQPIIEEYYRTDKDDIYYSILPTATQYARNALFAGLMPSVIQKKYPQYWIDEDEQVSKNKFEKELLHEQLKRFNKNIKFSYTKILNLDQGKKTVGNLSNLLSNNLNVVVYNFVDMISHARTEMEIIKELANDETAYRSLTVSWFEHSPLFDIIKFLSDKKVDIIITTDHGTIRSVNPIKIIGDKNTNTNLRYKCGRILKYNKKEVFEVINPENAFLPKTNISTSYIFCKEDSFFVYPNNYNYYMNYYKDTFQHGGISMEEMLIPVIKLKAK
jgi:CheY-like chemotaxis protein